MYFKLSHSTFLAHPFFTLFILLVLFTTSGDASAAPDAGAANYASAYAHGYAFAYGGMMGDGSDGRGSRGDGYSNNYEYYYRADASVVDSFTTVCPEPTVFAYKEKKYTATRSGETITIRDCPCTITSVGFVLSPPPSLYSSSSSSTSFWGKVFVPFIFFGLFGTMKEANLVSSACGV